MALSIGVQLNEDTEVGKRVLLAESWLLSLGSTENRLNFVGVDDTVEVRVDDLSVWETVINLVLSSLLVCSVERVELFDGSLGPDDKSSDVSSWSEGEEVKSVNIGKFDTGDVSESLGQGRLSVVDDQRTASLNVSAVSELTLTGSDLAGVDSSFDIAVSVEGLKDLNGLLGLLNINNIVSENERNLRDLLNSVSSGHHEGNRSRGGQSRDNGVSLLVLVDLSVPSAVCLSGGEHTTSTAHVSEGSLASTVCSTTRNTGNTCDSTTSTPRLS